MFCILQKSMIFVRQAKYASSAATSPPKVVANHLWYRQPPLVFAEGDQVVGGRRRTPDRLRRTPPEQSSGCFASDHQPPLVDWWNQRCSPKAIRWLVVGGEHQSTSPADRISDHQPPIANHLWCSPKAIWWLVVGGRWLCFSVFPWYVGSQAK